MKVEIGNRYLTRSGATFVAVAVDVPGRYPVLGYILLPRGQICPEIYTRDGQYYGSFDAAKEPLDLVEDITPRFPIDTPIWVRDDEHVWTPGYYAGERDGRPTTWVDGRTSWSIGAIDRDWGDDTRVSWDECRVPTVAELAIARASAP